MNINQLAISHKFICIIIILLVLDTIACGKQTNATSIPHIENKEVSEVMHRAIHAAGGWNSWKSLQHISYTKRSILYFSDSTVENDITQIHTYQLIPELRGEISWELGEDTHRIICTVDSTYKELNGKRLDGSLESAYREFMSAFYVLFVPFKLLDPGAHLKYEGIDTLDKGRVVDVIKATYDPSEHDNHSTSDVWWYYFDHLDGRHVASMVHHPPTYALIENTEMTDAHALRFNTYRETYRVDSTRNKEYLRGVFYYSDYVLVE